MIAEPDQIALPSGCSKCGLHECARSPFMLDGCHISNGQLVAGLPPIGEDSPIAVIMESPDATADSTASITRSESVLEAIKVIRAAAPEILHRCWFGFAVGCHTIGANPALPKNRDRASDKQIQYCSPLLQERLLMLRPAAIIPLGAAACGSILKSKNVIQLTGRAYMAKFAVPPPPTTVVNVKTGAAFDVYIGRDHGQHKNEGWGNPFPLPSNYNDFDEDDQKYARRRSLEQYKDHIRKQPQLMARLPELRGKRLGCWCHPEACHGDVLIELVDECLHEPVEKQVISIPVHPLWAVGYARGEERQLSKYLDLWRATASRIREADEAAASGVQLVCEIPRTFTMARTTSDVEKWFAPVLDNLDGPLAWDSETTGLQAWRKAFDVFLLSFHHESQPAPLLIPLNYDQQPFMSVRGDERSRRERQSTMELLKYIMELSRIQKIGHNLKFDETAVIAAFGWRPKGFLADTQVLEYCIDANTQGFRGVDDLVRKYIPSTGEYWRAVEAYKTAHPDQNFSQFPSDLMLPYAAMDTAVLPSLYRIMMQRLEDMTATGVGGHFIRTGNPNRTPTYSLLEYTMLGRRVHHHICTEMETNGLEVDHELIGRLSSHYTAVAEEARQSLCEDKKIVEFERTVLMDVMAKSARDKWMKAEYYTKLEPKAKPRTPLAQVRAKVLAAEVHPHINWNSIPQQKAFFIDYLKLEPVSLTESGAPSLDATALQEWALDGNLSAQSLLDYREADKFLTAYVHPMQVEGGDGIIQDDRRIHASFNITGPRTGRLAVTRPPLQAMPRDGLIKRLYPSRFPNGWISQRDYSGLEVRILALMCRDKALISAFKSGADPHFRTQQHFFRDKADKSNKTQRSICKGALFGRIYGQGDPGLFALLTKGKVISPDTGEPVTLEECASFNQMIDELYPAVPEWVKLVHRNAVQNQWVCSGFGFVAPLPSLAFYAKSRQTPNDRHLNSQVAQAMRQSQNYGIQGTASDVTMMAAYRINQLIRQARLKALVILVVHDSIYVDHPDEETLQVSAIMHDVMDNAAQWLPEVLPGFDATWIDIPVIGDGELGTNMKDALAAAEEPTMYPRAGIPNRLMLKVPKLDKDDARRDMVASLFGTEATINWSDARSEVREWLAAQRFVFN